MSSLRKVLASRANGARSNGPSTPLGKQRSSQNALRHGLLARCVVLENESRESFETLLGQHLDRFQPADGVEFGMIEEMVSSYWRMRRAWALETRMFENQIAAQPDAPSTADPASAELDRMATAFSNLAESPSLALMHRYETRLHLMHQRALHNFLLLRNLDPPNEPNPISEHPGALITLPAPSPSLSDDPPTEPQA
jgi:hypothetical protein